MSWVLHAWCNQQVSVWWFINYTTWFKAQLDKAGEMECLMCSRPAVWLYTHFCGCKLKLTLGFQPVVVDKINHIFHVLSCKYAQDSHLTIHLTALGGPGLQLVPCDRVRPQCHLLWIVSNVANQLLIYKIFPFFFSFPPKFRTRLVKADGIFYQAECWDQPLNSWTWALFQGSEKWLW